MSLIGLIRAGDIWGAIHKIISLIRGNPEVASFLHQFSTDFGAKALADAKDFAANVVADPTKFVEAAETLLNQLWTDAFGIAKEDAREVVRNALRVQVSALQIEANTAVA